MLLHPLLRSFYIGETVIWYFTSTSLLCLIQMIFETAWSLTITMKVALESIELGKKWIRCRYLLVAIQIFIIIWVLMLLCYCHCSFISRSFHYRLTLFLSHPLLFFYCPRLLHHPNNVVMLFAFPFFHFGLIYYYLVSHDPSWLIRYYSPSSPPLPYSPSLILSFYSIAITPGPCFKSWG